MVLGSTYIFFFFKHKTAYYMSISDWSSDVCSSDLLSGDKGLSLSERVANHFYRLTWRTPLHAMRLKGKYPLKLLAVPDDPIPGDERAGKALRAGYFLFRGTKKPLASLDFSNLDLATAFVDYIHSFRWIRDLSMLPLTEQAAPIAEAILRL